MFLEKIIQNELNKLDLSLFLDKEWRDGALFYLVKYNIGSGAEPLTVTEWSLAGHPLPLSTSIVDKVKMQEGDIRDAINTVIVNNAVKKANIQKEMVEAFETIQEEFHKSAKRLHMSGPWKPKYDASAYKKGKH